MHSTHLVPELVLVRVLTSGGPYRMGDELSLAFTTPTVARLVAHDLAVRTSCVPLAEAVVPEMISAIVIHAATPYVSGEVLTLSFVDPRIARLRPGELTTSGSIVAANAGELSDRSTDSIDLDATRPSRIFDDVGIPPAASSPVYGTVETQRQDLSERHAPATERRASLLGRGATAKTPAGAGASHATERPSLASGSRVETSEWPTRASAGPTQTDNEPMHSSDRPVLASEPIALASEPTALASEPTALASKPTALASKPTALREERPTFENESPAVTGLRTPSGYGNAAASCEFLATSMQHSVSTIEARPRGGAPASTDLNPSVEPRLTSRGSSAGVSVLLRWNPERVRRFVQVVDRLFTIDRLGWYRHCLAMRLLVPDEIRCGDTLASVEAMRHLHALRIAAVESLGKPLLAACMPGFSITSEWLGSLENAREARAVAGLRDALLPHANDEVPALDGFASVASVDDSVAQTHVQPAQVECTVGSVTRRQLLSDSASSVDAFLPLLIASSAHDPLLGLRVTEYRRLLIELFAQTARAAEPVRLNQMAQPNHSLDDRLWQLVGAVGGAFGGFALA